MKPIYQTILDKDTGDCWTACIASILERPLSTFPNFCSLKGNWLAKAEEWLRENCQVTLLGFRPKGEGAFFCRPAMYHIMSGPGPRECLHSVVGFRGDMVHDPHPSGKGLLAIEEYEFLLPYVPSLGYLYDAPTAM